MDVAKVEINSSKLFWISGVNFAQPNDHYRAQQFINFIRYNNIDTIVNLSDYPVSSNMVMLYRQAGVENILRFPLDDRFFNRNEYPELKRVMERLYNRIGSRVLVHCSAGVNRSATFIVYSILKDSYLSPLEVITKVRESNYKWRNTPTLINPTFVDFLEVQKYIK